MNKNYITCIKILKEAFDANVRAHDCAESSQYAYYLGDYDQANEYSEAKNSFYEEKSNKIKEAIHLIKKYKIPIKWGVNDWICYFNIHWRQISFHIFTNKKYKKYNWKWSYRRNTNKFPINIDNIVL